MRFRHHTSAFYDGSFAPPLCPISAGPTPKCVSSHPHGHNNGLSLPFTSKQFTQEHLPHHSVKHPSCYSNYSQCAFFSHFFTPLKRTLSNSQHCALFKISLLNIYYIMLYKRLMILLSPCPTARNRLRKAKHLLNISDLLISPKFSLCKMCCNSENRKFYLQFLSSELHIDTDISRFIQDDKATAHAPKIFKSS